MDEPWARASESPTCIHVITGAGLPEALQDNETFPPSTAISTLLEISIVGATNKRIVELILLRTK